MAGGLSGVGLKTQMLDTQSLIELYYNCYNPEMADWQKVADINQLRIEA